MDTEKNSEICFMGRICKKCSKLSMHNIAAFVKNHRKCLISLSVIFLFILGALAVFSKYPALLPFNVNEVAHKVNKPEYNNKIGWISDIHADRFKKREVDSGMIYPKQYKDYFPLVLDEMKSQGIETVIATGDNTNTGDDNYSRHLAEIAKEKKMNMIWVKGNHDREKSMAELGITEKAYYSLDFEDVRIIVLNNTDTDDYLGVIDDKQMEWMKEKLNTDKKIIIAMHIPIFYEERLSERYIEFEKIISEKGNVKLVLAGHYHNAWQKVFNGIGYYVQGALTLKGKKGAYAVIDLNEMSINYKFTGDIKK